MADRFLREVQRMHQLRRDINEMTPEEADELIRGLGDDAGRGLGLCRARCTTAAARSVMVLAVSRRPRRRQIALDVGSGAYCGSRWHQAHSLYRSNHDRFSRCQRQACYLRDMLARLRYALWRLAQQGEMSDDIVIRPAS